MRDAAAILAADLAAAGHPDATAKAAATLDALTGFVAANREPWPTAAPEAALEALREVLR